MEQPATPNAISQKDSKSKSTNRKMPTPQELISHYQTQGLDSQEASVKVIEDLQNVLMRVISSNGKAKRDRLLLDASKKMDTVNARLAVVEMKLDSKPGYVDTFAIGIVSGAALQGIAAVWPHVLQGVSQIWTAVRNVTNPSSSSPP